MPQSNGDRIPPPGDELEALFHHLTVRLRAYWVGIGRYGPQVVQVRPAVDDEELSYYALSESMRLLLDKESGGWTTLMSGKSIVAANVSSVPVPSPMPERWHPGRFIAAQMDASWRYRVKGASLEEIGAAYNLRGWDQPANDGRVRFKSVQKMVNSGDVSWMRLGGFPWAAFGRPSTSRADDPVDFIPDRWWETRDARVELAAACQFGADRARRDEAEGHRQARLSAEATAAFEQAAAALAD